MEKFLNKKVSVITCMGGTYGAADFYKGVFTSYDDNFICLNNKTYIAIKYIMTIDVK
ncbi:MAG: hypothetical protein J6J36_01700 [Clostridia bacterium]|nr:hypothetical protein [Clostridia bacterium]